MRSVNAQDIGRIIFVGGLLGIFVVLLLWAFNPDDEGGLAFSGGDPEATPTGEITPTEATEEPTPEVTPTPTPTPEPTATGPSSEELQALIEAAPEPSSTTVQVLDAGGGGDRAQSAADALEDFGYQVVNITAARANLSDTTIWFNAAAEDAALALQAREERIAEVEPNEALSTGVDIHLLVGPDWTS